jgi:hypothetical protein
MRLNRGLIARDSDTSAALLGMMASQHLPEEVTTWVISMP